MASIIKVDTIQDQDGNNIISEAANTITIGASGDTITIPSGATLANSGIVTGFQSTGIDDNATSTAITINSSNNVGIGTSSPNNYTNYKFLTINGTTGGGLDFESNGTLMGEIYCDTTKFVIDSEGAVPLVFRTNSVLERMRIDSSGNVGIGTSSPSASYGKLTVAGGITIADDNNAKLQIGRYSSGASNSYIKMGANSNSLRFTNPADTADLMTIGSTGNVGIGTTSPSNKLHVKGTWVTNEGIMQIDANSGTQYSGLTLQNNGTARTYFYHDNTNNLTFLGSTTGDHLVFATNSITERMRITSSGDVGIGTSSPSTKLDVNGTVKFVDTMSFSDSGATVSCFLQASGNIFQYGTSTSDDIAIYTNNAERMRIASDGVVGIGTTSPSSSYRLSAVGGTGAVVGAFIETTSTTSGHEASIIKRPNSGVLVQFLGSGQVGSITTNGSTTTYGTSSDYRLKENVVDLTNATERLKQLRPKRFNFISDADTTVDGFIAHEVSSVVPEAIHGTKDEVDADGNPKYQNIDQSKLVPLLVKTIQELEARITALETNQP